MVAPLKHRVKRIRKNQVPRVLDVPVIGFPPKTRFGQAAMKYLRGRDNHSGSSGHFIYGYINNALHSKETDNHACHAGLSNFNQAKALWTYFPHSNGQDVSKEIELSFIKYLMYRSPWQNVMVQTDPEFAWTKGFIIEDMTQPANLIANFCIVSRMCGEYPQSIKFWHTAVKAGANENVALLFALSINFKGKNAYYSGPLSWSFYDPGHNPFNSASMSKKYAENFFLGKPTNFLKPFHVDPNYIPCNTLWGMCGDFDRYSQFVMNNYNPAKKADGRLFKVGADQNDAMFSRERWIEITIKESARMSLMGVANAERKEIVGVG